MDQIQRQFWQTIRSFLIRYNEYNRQKGASPLQLDQFQQIYAKMLSNRELKEVVINKIISIQLKSDYHNLIMLTLLHDLSKWSREYHASLRQYSGLLDCILTQSINILNGQQQYHTIVPKQNQLISLLLSHPHTLENIEQFKILYRRLKDIKQFYPSSIRQHQKQCFLKAIEQCIEKSSQIQNIKIIEFIFNNIFNQLENLQETHEYVSQRLKIIKKMVKNLWTYHEQILYKVAYLLMKYSYQITTNKHLFNYIIPIYQCLMSKLIQKPSIAPLLIFRHLVFNNIKKILESGGSYIVLEVLLSQLANNFEHTSLAYFMKNYDWNYLELPICQQSLNILYQYTQNRAHQKKVQFQLIKTYINRMHLQVKAELERLKGAKRDESKWKFYQLKRKEYQQLLEELNDKPKKIFKKIQTISNKDVREAAINKHVRIVKKSAHLKNRSMIDIFSTDHVISAQLFSHYVEIVLKQCKQYNLQEFMRLFTSNFFLTGESQQIGRVMDTITQLYFSHQQQSNRILKSSDATYTFANAILILNTDLHNPKNQEKMSQQNFIKMCKKINDGDDLPLDVIKKTYNNIKKNKINTFRDRGDMIGISVSNWLNICTDYESLPLSYYDNQLQNLDEKCLQYFIYDVLTSIIDEKQTAKLQVLVQRFIYDDKIFQCQIIQTLRKIIDKKPHLPLHILQKILELANFKNSKISNKLLSYYWLGTNVITTFPNLIPTNVICQFFVFTWNIRIELQDNLHLRELAEMKRIKQSIRYITKREAKKSLMDMFTNFLSFKQSDDQVEKQPNQFNRKNTFKSLSNNIFDILKYSQQHKNIGVQFLIKYIYNEQSKQYEQFVSCLFLTFNLMYFIDNCESICQDLFYQLLGLKESSITKRLNNLGKKDNKLYNVLINYCKFWIAKLLLKEYCPSKLESKENNNYQYLLNKSLEYLQKIDKEILNDLLKELTHKKQIHPIIYDAFDKIIKKIYANQNCQEVRAFIDKVVKVEDKLEENHQKQLQGKQQQHAKQEQQPPLNNQNSAQPQVKQFKKSLKDLQNQHEQNPKLTSKLHLNQKLKEQTNITKQNSVNQLQVYINPDEDSNLTQEKIQSPKIKQEQQVALDKKNHQQKVQKIEDKLEEDQPANQEKENQQKPKEQNQKIEQDSSSIVVMF